LKYAACPVAGNSVRAVRMSGVELTGAPYGRCVAADAFAVSDPRVTE